MNKPHTPPRRWPLKLLAAGALASVAAACGGGGSAQVASFASQITSNCTSTTPSQDCPLSPEIPNIPDKPCSGQPIPALGSVLFAPTVPQPSSAKDVVGANIQNLGATESGSHFHTYGQMFGPGQVQSNRLLAAEANGISTPVQLDMLAAWPDGSVKLAALSYKIPSICANAQIPVMLYDSGKSVVIEGTQANAVDLAAALPKLEVTLAFTSGSYTGTHTVDLGAALKTSLATAPDHWLRGPLVSQARVDVPLANGTSDSTSTLHLTADVSVYADGTALADVQFNNDLTTVLPQTGRTNPAGPLAALDYTATVVFGNQQTQHTVSQVQYTAWHTLLHSQTAPQLHIQQDAAHLIRTGAVLPYDLSTGVNTSLIQKYEQNIIAKQTFGTPLASNGITTYMPMTGGRGDIGYTTQFNTVWLMTQDARAAKVALAQSDTSGAIPWNYKLPNGRWLMPDSYPKIWVDWRGGPQNGGDGIANTASNAVWGVDIAHQPNLNFLPYLMSAGRWHYDRQLAQAAASLTAVWPTYRCKTSMCVTLLNERNQVRSQAWAMRELLQAAFISKTSSYEQTWFAQVVADNWQFQRSRQVALATAQGEATGWMPGDYGNKGATAPWQQDFLTAMAIMGAGMGDESAKAFVAWQTPWISGRFVGSGMNPYDGCTYNLRISNTAGEPYLKSWTDIEAATVATGLSNGQTWKNSNGYYCALAQSTLFGALRFSPNSPQIQDAADWLKTAKAPYTDQASFRNDPTFNIAPSLR